jgi:prolipoprotein diacylglyceryltransferase
VESYSVFLAIGVFISFLWLALTGPASMRLASLDAGLAALAGGLIGGRAAFVLAHASYYSAHVVEAFWFWQGGLNWAGAAAGAFVGLALYARLAGHRLWPLADSLSVPVAALSLAAWAGCWADGCAYGRRVPPGPWSPPATDYFGVVAPRWPTQAAGMALSLVALGLAYAVGSHTPAPAAHRRCGAGEAPAGLAFGLTLLALAAGSLGIAFVRGDPGPSIAGIRADALGSAAILVAATAVTIARFRAR